MPKRLSPKLSLRSVLEWMLRRPVVIVLVISAATIFFASNLPGLSFRTSVYDLIIEDLPETTRYKELKKVFGSDEIIRVVVKADNVLAPETFVNIARLAEDMSAIEGVRRVISLPGIKKAVDVSEKWSIEEFSAVAAPVELFHRNLISADQKATGITLVLESDVDKQGVIQSVEKIISAAPERLSIYQIGMPLVSQALAALTVKDFFSLPPITLMLITGVLYLFFRRLSYLFLPILCVTLVLIWTLGFMALIRIPLTMLTMIVPVFLIAVGTAYCLHVMAEYNTCALRAVSPAAAVTATFSNTALPCVLAVFTTMTALASLWINPIVAIHEFALFACFGMLSLLVIILTLLPCGLVLIPLPKNKNKGGTRVNLHLDRFLEIIAQLTLKHQKGILIVAGIAVILGVTGIFLIKVETNPVEYFKPNTSISRNFHDIYQKLSGSFPINLVIKSDNKYYFEDPRHIERISDVQKFLVTLPGVDKTISFADYARLVNYALNRYDPKYYALPEEAFEARMVINNYKTLLGEDMFVRFMNPDYSETNVILLTHISSSGEFLKTRDRILAHLEEHFPKDLQWSVTGFGMAISASSHLLTSGQVKSISVGLLLIFGIMFLMFLSVKVGLIAILPNFFPIIMNFGLMGWLGIKLSMVTSLIASVAIGLAVDDTIHYLHRYNREFKKDLDKDRALRATIQQVGKPIVFTTLTISIGFFILIFSSFKPTAVFGLLMVITMFSALAGDLIILPALMRHVELVTAWDLMKLMPTPGAMPAGIAHELNQPLNAIKMGSDFLKMMISRQANIKYEHINQVVNEISTQVDRASEIINRLRVFGQKPDFELERIDINEAIKDVIAIVGHQLSLDDIEIKLDLDKTLPPIWGHLNRLGQVVYNLVTNAGDAINEKKKTADDTSHHIIRVCTHQEDNQIVMAVSDTGIGIPAGNIRRIREPFFTTKAMGQGKGLGLSISYEIVKDFGGRIDVQSDENKGTTLKVIFPPARS